MLQCKRIGGAFICMCHIPHISLAHCSFITPFFTQPYTDHRTRWAQRKRLPPSCVTQTRGLVWTQPKYTKFPPGAGRQWVIKSNTPNPPPHTPRRDGTACRKIVVKSATTTHRDNTPRAPNTRAGDILSAWGRGEKQQRKGKSKHKGCVVCAAFGEKHVLNILIVKVQRRQQHNRHTPRAQGAEEQL